MTARCIPLRGARIAILIALTASVAMAQEPVERVRDLYANAAYEEVLRAVTAVTTDEHPVAPALGQYVVFSLVALGRADDAERAAERLITAAPEFRPDADASPRVLELFTAVRRRIGPGLLKQMYLAGKATFDQKDRDAAVATFTKLMTVADDPDLRTDPAVAELRFLASAFLDLSRASLASPPAVASGPPPHDAGAAVPPTAPKTAPPRITLARPIRESFPPWTPPDALARSELRGTILVAIDAAGRVSSSRLVTSISPFYDGKLLEASRLWTYEPATSNGVAVASERAVEVVLHPRQ